jgi:phage I-like protein
VTVLLEASLPATPLVLLGDGAEGSSVTSRVQVAKTGRFWDPRYGKFSITAAEFTKWMDNFQRVHLAEGRMGMPVDVDHGPEKRGDTKAAGWVVKLDTLGADGKTATPSELWATVEWNQLGQDLVGNKVYAYLSPSYQANYRDETGKALGTAMVGIGLTNRPFLKMATVSLDELDEAGIELSDRPGADPADSPPEMSDFLKRAREALQLSDDVTEDKVLEAIAAKAAETTPAPTTKTLAELAKEQGAVVLSEDQFTGMQAEIAKGVEASKTLAETKRDAAWDKALAETRVVPAQKDSLLAVHDSNPELFFKLLSEAQPQAHTTPVGGTGGGLGVRGDSTELEKDWEVDPERAELDRKVKALAVSENIDYGVALDRVLGEVA